MRKKIALLLIIVGLFLGLISNVRIAFFEYQYIVNKSRWNIGTYFGFASYMYAVLENSKTIKRIKEKIPSEGTIGFLSELPYGHEFMMYCTLQHLLSPVLLDRDNPKKYEYAILFSKRLARDDLRGGSIEALGYGLYLIQKKQSFLRGE